MSFEDKVGGSSSNLFLSSNGISLTVLNGGMSFGRKDMVEDCLLRCLLRANSGSSNGIPSTILNGGMSVRGMSLNVCESSVWNAGMSVSGMNASSAYI